MWFELDPIYLVYLSVAISAGFLVEGIYLLFFSGASYRKSVNRRLKLLRNEPNRENILLQLRKERGLTSTGSYRLGLEAFNRLVLQSGLTIGMSKLFACAGVSAVIAFGLGWVLRRDVVEALLIAVFSIAMQAQTRFDQTSAARFAHLALACVHREYPNKIAHVLNSDADVHTPGIRGSQTPLANQWDGEPMISGDPTRSGRSVLATPLNAPLLVTISPVGGWRSVCASAAK